MPAGRARRVRRWLIGSTVALLVCSVAVSLVVIGVTGARNADRAADAMLTGIGERTADHVRSELSGPVAARQQLASVVARGTIDDATLERLLAADLASFPQLSGAYVGYPDGRFVFVRRSGDELILKRVEVAPRRATEATLAADLSPGPAAEIADSYDPTGRPWFQSAAATGGPVWTDPYVFHASQQPGVTSAQPVHGGHGRLVAVVGVDIEVSTLNRLLADLPIDASAEAFIIASEQVVAAPSSYTVVNQTRGRFGLLASSQLGFSSGLLEQAELRAISAEGRRAVATTFDDPAMPDWTIAVQTDRIELVDSVRRQTNIALATTVVAAVLLLAALLWALRRLRAPFQDLVADAQLDALTGLANRRALHERGGAVIGRAVRDGSDVAVAVLDVDEFKALNDQLGHSAGDRILQHVATALAHAAGADDLVARFGGDEFVVVLPRHAGALAEAVEALYASVEATLSAHAGATGCHATVGVARRAGRPISFATLFDEADAALMAAKRSGTKRRVVWADQPAPEPVTA